MLGIKKFLPSKKNEKKEQTIVLLCVDLYLITMYTYTVHAFFFFSDNFHPLWCSEKNS